MHGDFVREEKARREAKHAALEDRFAHRAMETVRDLVRVRVRDKQRKG